MPKEKEIPNATLQRLKMSRDQARHLAREQEIHKVDIAQPGSELFEKAWGPTLARRSQEKAKRETEARDAWEESRSRREFEKRRDHPTFR